MKLKHGDFKWVVAHRNYSKFKELNRDLLKIAEKTFLPGQRLYNINKQTKLKRSLHTLHYNNIKTKYPLLQKSPFF